MKYFTLIILLILLPFCALAIDSQDTSQLPELSPLTKQSMQRTTNATIDPQGQLNLNTSNSFRSVTFVRIGEDGKNETLCTSNELEARKFLAGKKTTPQDEGE